MPKQNNSIVLHEELIIRKIYYIRNQKVMFDSDLAELYSIETKRLKEQVRRNIDRFPSHYMFELTKEELNASRSHFATLKRGDNMKYLPYVFTEHGVLMLSNVIKSKQAIAVSMKIIDVFIKLREILTTHSELRSEIEKIKQKLTNHSKNIELVFQYLDELIDKQTQAKPRTRIGYKIKGK